MSILLQYLRLPRQKCLSAKQSLHPISPIYCPRTTRRLHRSSAYPQNLSIFSEENIEVLGSLGDQISRAFSTTPKQEANAALLASAGDLGEYLKPALDARAIGSDTSVEVQIRRGRLKHGELSGLEVLLKCYPPASGHRSDCLVQNEVAAHAALQQLFLGVTVPGSEKIVHLLGHVSSQSKEQILVFRKDATANLEQFGQEAAQNLYHEHSEADVQNFGQRPEKAKLLYSQKLFVKRLIVQMLQGLAFIHKRNRIHQRLVPTNVLLSTTRLAAADSLSVQLQDLALAVDISDSALVGGATLAEIWSQKKLNNDDPLKALAEPVWERARQAGALSAAEQRLFAVSEDVAAAGLLVAYLALVPFSAPASIDFPTIKRLFGATFQAEMGAAREYCEADERWTQGVHFLNEEIGSGWDLIQSMLFPDFRLRPSPEACLSHPFLAQTS